MLYPLIPRDDVDCLIAKYRNKFLKAKKPQERAALWQKLIHEFRLVCYLWHLESQDCIGRAIWWITPKHTKYARWYEVCQGVVTDVHDSVFFVQAGKKNVTVRMNHILALAGGRNEHA
nr:MAG TPA: hypothetical protein [Bacteriophage sp.]